MMLLLYFYLFVFLIGLCVGSFLNVVVGRLPYEKSLLWPSSRCPFCLQAIRWHDNIPLVSYLVLRGRCRTCRQSISPRYFFIELFTGLAFVALFHLEMVANVLELPTITRLARFAPGGVPLEATLVYWHHAILLSFLLAASLCDLMDMEIPIQIPLAGTAVGLVLATLLPWPCPEQYFGPATAGPAVPPFPPTRGVYAWPVWYPLPSWLPPGSWQLGLATGLAGSIAGMALVRIVAALFALGAGKEGLGLGDADLMMMAGAFLGWQAVLIAFFVAVAPGLLVGLATLIWRGNQALPYGPSLSLGVMLTVLLWPLIGPAFAPLMFDPLLMGGLAVAAAVSLLAVSLLLRVI